MGKIISVFLLMFLTAVQPAGGNISPDNYMKEEIKHESSDNDVLDAEKSYILYEMQADKADNEQKTYIKIALEQKLRAIGYDDARIWIDEDEMTVVFDSVVDNIEEIAKYLKEPFKITFVDYQGNVLLTREDIQDVEVKYGCVNITDDEEYYISLLFTKNGAEKFKNATRYIAELSSENNRLYIYIDGNIYSAPTVTEEIDSDECIITGAFDKDTAQDFASLIKASQIPIEIIKIHNPNTD